MRYTLIIDGLYYGHTVREGRALTVLQDEDLIAVRENLFCVARHENDTAAFPVGIDNVQDVCLGRNIESCQRFIEKKDVRLLHQN